MPAVHRRRAGRFRAARSGPQADNILRPLRPRKFGTSRPRSEPAPAVWGHHTGPKTTRSRSLFLKLAPRIGPMRVYIPIMIAATADAASRDVRAIYDRAIYDNVLYRIVEYPRKRPIPREHTLFTLDWIKNPTSAAAPISGSTRAKRATRWPVPSNSASSARSATAAFRTNSSAPPGSTCWSRPSSSETRSIWRWPTRSCGARAGRSATTCCGMSHRSAGSTSG